MKVKLLRDVRKIGRTGEIAEVSPDGFEYLTSLGLAVPVREIREQVETPEKEPEAEKTVKVPARPKTAAKPVAKATEKAKTKAKTSVKEKK